MTLSEMIALCTVPATSAGVAWKGVAAPPAYFNACFRQLDSSENSSVPPLLLPLPPLLLYPPLLLPAAAAAASRRLYSSVKGSDHMAPVSVATSTVRLVPFQGSPHRMTASSERAVAAGCCCKAESSCCEPVRESAGEQHKTTEGRCSLGAWWGVKLGSASGRDPTAPELSTCCSTQLRCRMSGWFPSRGQHIVWQPQASVPRLLAAAAGWSAAAVNRSGSL